MSSFYSGVLGFILGGVAATAVVSYYLEPEDVSISQHESYSGRNNQGLLPEISSVASHSEIMKSNGENPKLQKKIRKLEDQIEGLESRLEIALIKVAEPEGTEISDVQRELIELKTAVAKQKFSEAERYFSENKIHLGKNVNDVLNNLFMKEILDANWAYTQERAIDTSLSGSEFKESLSIISRNCRTNQCRITYLNENIEPHKLFSQLNQNKQWKSFITAPNTSTGVVEIYLQREVDGSLN